MLIILAAFVGVIILTGAGVNEPAIEKTTFFTTSVNTQPDTAKPTTIPQLTTDAPQPTTISLETVEEQHENNEINQEVEYEKSVPKETVTCVYLDDDAQVDLLARVIYQESGTCSEHCQWLVGSTAMNLADEYGGLENVAYDYNIFNVAGLLYRATPSDLSYSVARRVLSGDRNYSVKAFRTDYFHNFGTPYISADNVYFSTY